MYLGLSEIDRRRPADQRMSAETALLMQAHFAKLHDQFKIFSEFSGLNDASITGFVSVAEKIDQIHDPMLRGDAMGIFQANLGLWQILARQGQIAAGDFNSSWSKAIDPFNAVTNYPQLFDAGQASLAEVMRGASGSPDINQQKVIALLAGPEQTTPDGRQVRERLAIKMRAVMTDQRLVSLDTIFELGADFSQRGKSAANFDKERATQLAEELEAERTPRAMFTEAERAQWAPGHEPNRHILAEMRTDVKKSVGVSLSVEDSTAMRGTLAPFLRDTLVGLNYAYYEPAGAQTLHSSPLLVRAHDFLAAQASGENRAWLAPELFGVGMTAGQGTHLSGSLVGLPYTLAQIEQDFIVPENVQALIWQETAADLLTTGMVPRWWLTAQDDLHAVALYQKTGEEIIEQAAQNTEVRARVLIILSNRLLAEMYDRTAVALAAGNAQGALTDVAPADTFFLAITYRQQFPDKNPAAGSAAAELEAMAQRHPEQVDANRLSREFGIPHPMLASSYAGEMLNLKPLPSVMDYASEYLAESWESTNLYWARLADETGYTPAMLNELVPVLTRRMVEKIFGSDFDDWRALIRAMRETGDEFRRGQVAGVPKAVIPLQP